MSFYSLSIFSTGRLASCPGLKPGNWISNDQLVPTCDIHLFCTPVFMMWTLVMVPKTKKHFSSLCTPGLNFIWSELPPSLTYLDIQDVWEKIVQFEFVPQRVVTYNKLDNIRSDQIWQTFYLLWLTLCLVETDWDRIIKNIERGEARITRKDEINRALKKKLERYKNPWLELKIQYGQNKGKLYNEECDRFMVWIYTCFWLSKLQTFKFSSSNIYCCGVIFGCYLVMFKYPHSSDKTQKFCQGNPNKEWWWRW